MTAERAELVAQVLHSLSTRSVNQFAEEARQDGESLQESVQRYEIDYAWRVLSSERMRDETVSVLEARRSQVATPAEKIDIAQILSSAAAQQPSDLLMSFDNDVAELLVQQLCAETRL